MDKPPLIDADERIFTLFDVQRLFRKSKRQVFKAAIIGAILAFCFVIIKQPRYRIEATFKEGIEKTGSEGVSLKELMGVSGTTEPQAITLMQSYQVLRPLVVHLGLQASVPKRGILSKVYRRVRDNFKAEFGMPLCELDAFSFNDVKFAGELPLSYGLRFSDPTHFTISSGIDGEVQGVLGEEVVLSDSTFTIASTPNSLRIGKTYPLLIGSWTSSVDDVRSRLKITSDKANKSIYKLTFSDRNRRLGTQVLNCLMSEYRKYLKKDHDQIAGEQLAYLEGRQNQIYGNLSTSFDEHTSYLQKNFQDNGSLRIVEEVEGILSVYQNLSAKVMSLETEASRLSLIEKEQVVVIPSDDSPFFRSISEIARQIQDLKQQRDLVELAVKNGSQDGDPIHYEERKAELREIREKRDTVRLLLNAVDSGRPIAFDQFAGSEEALAQWVDQITNHEQRLQVSASDALPSAAGKELEREDLSEYLENYLRLLTVQEKIVQDRVYYGAAIPEELAGVDLATAKVLFLDYNNKLDQSLAQALHYEELQKEIELDNFEVSSLAAVLSDPLSAKLVLQASDIALKLKDEKHRSEKEGDRWKEELTLQKKILADHLQQLAKVERLKSGLIRRKISGLQQATIGCVSNQISVLHERLSDQIKERKAALAQEQQILKTKMEQMRSGFTNFPERWQKEKLLEFKTEMGVKMMEGLCQLVESKTIGQHLHNVASKPLDPAVIPFVPASPRLRLMMFLGAFAAGFGLFFSRLLRAVLNGFPTSMEKLRAMRLPLLGQIGSHCDGPLAGNTSGPDLELIRQASLFLDQAPSGKVVALLNGKGPDFSYALAENLARMSRRSLLIRCDFRSKFRAEEQPGLLQIWKGECGEIPIRKGKGYDLLTSGGFTPYGAEIVQSEAFLKLLTMLKTGYDAIFLVFRSSLDSAETLAALRLSDKAIATTAGEPTEQLTALIDWAYHDGMCRLSFVTAEEG